VQSQDWHGLSHVDAPRMTPGAGHGVVMVGGCPCQDLHLGRKVLPAAGEAPVACAGCRKWHLTLDWVAVLGARLGAQGRLLAHNAAQLVHASCESPRSVLWDACVGMQCMLCNWACHSL
jgi:hypothetical protein